MPCYGHSHKNSDTNSKLFCRQVCGGRHYHVQNGRKRGLRFTEHRQHCHLRRLYELALSTRHEPNMRRLCVWTGGRRRGTWRINLQRMRLKKNALLENLCPL